MEGVTPTPAKELTKKEAEAIVSAAFESERRIKIAAVNIHEAWWELAEQLYLFHERGYWSYLGYESLDEFLAQPDLGMSRSQFFAMTKMWRDLIVVKQLDAGRVKQLEPSKVKEVTPAIMRGDVDVDKALDDAAGMSYRDVKTTYRPEKQSQHGTRADGSEPLDASAEPVYVQCEACGSWYLPDVEEGKV